METYCQECGELIKDDNSDRVVLASRPFGVFCCMTCAHKFIDEYGPENNDYYGVD